MKRRSFVKKSISASILTPLAFSGLINAAGATEGGTEGGTENTTVPETSGFFETTDYQSTDIIGGCSYGGVSRTPYCDVTVNGNTKRVYKCTKTGYSFPKLCDGNSVESQAATDKCNNGDCTMVS